MLSNILMGFSTAFNPMNLLLLMGGTVLGILFGALPGVSSTMGVAVLIPLTYGMDAASGLIMLAGIYCGSTDGGSISACLLNTPGTPASGKRNDGRIRTDDHRISFKRFSFKRIPFWIIRSSCFNGWNGCCDSISKIYL